MGSLCSKVSILRGFLGGYWLVTRRAPESGTQHGPKGDSMVWNNRLIEAAGSASLCLQGFPRKHLDMGG